MATGFETRYHPPMVVDVVQRAGRRKYPVRRLKQIAGAVLELTGRPDAELSLALIGNAEMQKLNARYRRKDYPTDVLSFPAADYLPGDAVPLGDVIISLDKAAAQAKEHRHTLDQEVVTLVIHGIVHLLGYDHERSAEAARIMSRLEKKIARQLCERGLLRV